MPLLPAVGVVSYGDFTFPTALHSQVRYSSEYTSDRRALKLGRFSLTIECILQDNSGLDLELTRRILTTPRLRFVYTGQGFVDIDDDGDLDFGPRPQVLLWESLGGGKAARIVWTVDVTLKPCFGTTITGTFSEFSYAVEFNVPINGRTRRLISGYAEIISLVRGTTNQAPGISNSIDEKWEFICPPRIPGFHRETNRSLNPDKRSMTFQIVDAQVDSDNAYPEFMVKCKATQRVTNGFPILPSSVNTWKIGLNARFTVGPGAAKSLAWTAFLALVHDRIRAAGQARRSSADSPLQGFIMMTSLEIEDEIFGQDVSFSVTWVITSSLESILQSSGIWRAMPGTNWARWSTSMDMMIGDFGPTGIKHRASDDVIVTVCTPATAKQTLLPHIVNAKYGAISIFRPPTPPENESWLDWKCLISVRRVGDYTPMKAAGQGDADQAGLLERVIGTISDAIPGGTTTITSPGGGVKGQEVEAQTSYASDLQIVLSGYALRVAHTITEANVPTVSSIGGKTPPLVDDEVVTANCAIGNYMGNQVYCRRWRRVYTVVGKYSAFDVKAKGNPKGYKFDR